MDRVDPQLYGPDDDIRCEVCNGDGGWSFCAKCASDAMEEALLDRV